MQGNLFEQHEEDRLLLGWETLHLQGYDMTVLEDDDNDDLSYSPSDSLLMDLGGNAFALPIIIAMLLSLYNHIDISAATSDNASIHHAPCACSEFVWRTICNA